MQRCQWHKRENVVSYLTKPQQVLWRRKRQAAYAHGGYAVAQHALQLGRSWPASMNRQPTVWMRASQKRSRGIASAFTRTCDAVWRRPN